MATRKEKITENDIQLFLLGELSGKKADKIREIDNTLHLNLAGSEQKRIKSTLNKIRRVDQLLAEAADRSFPMPEELGKKIETILSTNMKVQAGGRNLFLSRLWDFFASINVWSIASGGAVASFCLVVLVNIQPDLLLRDELLASKYSGSGAVNRESIGRSGSNFSQSLSMQKRPNLEANGSSLNTAQDGNLLNLKTEFSDSPRSWVVTDEFLFKPVELQNPSLIDGLPASSYKELNIFGEFKISILPLKKISVSMTLEDAKGNLFSLADMKEIASGIEVVFPTQDRSSTLDKFAQSGSGSVLRFKTSSGYSYSIPVNFLQ